jgi:hypothetical protein
MDERRRFTRVPFASAARLEGPDGVHDVHVIDLSLNGVLVAPADGSALPDQANAAYRLRLTLSSSADISMDLRLAHIQLGYAGFVCERIDIDSLTHLRRLFELNLADPALLQRELNALVTG